jgi:hypothetical protein
MLISLFLASTVLNEIQYSIPAFIGAAAMLFSFFQHISLVKPHYLKMSTIELQKNISRFRVHTSKYSKYDISIDSRGDFFDSWIAYKSRASIVSGTVNGAVSRPYKTTMIHTKTCSKNLEPNVKIVA